MEKSFETFEEVIARRLFRVQQNREAMPKTATKQEKKNETLELKTGASSQTELVEPDFVRIEKNIAGFGFFTPSSKRIQNVPKIIRFTQTVDGNRVEAQVKISGNVEYGMPITADQDKYLAFQKIIERVKRQQGSVSNPIVFTTAEILSLLGTSKNGNRYREVEEWLKVMNTTFIESEGAVWLNGKKRFASDSFVIFQRVRRTGQELDDGSVADKNYVWLSDWYLENLNAHYLLPVDFESYKLLKNNISKALVPLLQIWLYASREHGSFEKRYSELCQTLNISEYRFLSKIKEKLAPSLDELVEYGYLDSWQAEKTSDKKDFKIIFRHGWKFYADRRKIKQPVKREKTENGSLRGEKTPEAGNIPAGQKKGSESQFEASGEISDAARETAFGDNLPSTLTGEHLELIKTLHFGFQISYEKAVELVSANAEETARQIEAYPFRENSPKNKAGFLIGAIEQKYSLPESYETHLSRRKEAEEAANRQAEIDACPICNEIGYRNVKSEMDTFYGVMHECTHDEKFEAQFEEHKF